MTPETLFNRLYEAIDSGVETTELTRESVLASSPDWHREAALTFGSWEQYLAAAVIRLRGQVSGERRVDESTQDEPRPDRVVDGRSRGHVFGVSDQGYAFVVPMETLPSDASPGLAWVDGAEDHLLQRLDSSEDDTGVLLFTSAGNGLAVDMRLLSVWEPGALIRSLQLRFSGLVAGEKIVCALPKRALRTGNRLHFITTDGQVKVSDPAEYRKLSSEALLATVLRDGDALCTVVAAPEESLLSLWSSMGKALVFETSEIRSQGRKAGGVRGIQLDEGAGVVSGFTANDHAMVILATAQGFLKRMRLSDFRSQGRAGGGLQTCRLSPGDTVACVAPVELDGDVVLLTSSGLIARFPAYDVPLHGRAARGEAMLQLSAGETIVHVSGVPAGAWAGGAP